MTLSSRSGRLSCIGCLLVLPWLFALVFMTGCPAGGTGNGNGNNNGNGNGNGNGNQSSNGEIITPSSNFGLSLSDPPFQVRYSVPDSATSISGYRLRVVDSSPNSPAIGDPVTIAANLSSGSNRFFDFDPSEAGVGFFRVGVAFTFEGDNETAESSGVIQVQGPPDPRFILPAQPLTVVEQGSNVTVTFDAGDPEGVVQWRAFVLGSDDSQTAPPDRLGAQLAVGSGNVGTITFLTGGLPEGDYILGLSATDSGMSVAATVAAGQSDRIVTIPRTGVETPRVRVVAQGSIIVPSITITNPGNADIDLFKDETFTIGLTATLPPGGTGEVEVFYDTDTNVNNGFTIIADNLPVTTTQVEFPSNVPEGTYFIGATIRDGINAPVTDYSTGRVIVTRTITLSVTEPNTSLSVAPGSAVSIRWTTNAPADSGTVDVFAQRLNTNNQPTGAVIPIVTAGVMTLRTATFTSATSGLFRITVRLNITGQAAISDVSPRPVRVTSLPAIAWLGSVAEENSSIDGAIFGGVNFEDNAGSSFTKADDLDGDGLNEFVITSRYAKPFFINPSGVGPGEAYVVYGERGTSRLTGEYNLNSVSTSLLRGIALTGIRTQGNNSQTNGIADVLSVPDVDGDGKEELVLGFPFVDSASLDGNPFDGRIDEGVNLGPSICVNPTRNAHFNKGGIVVLSSANSSLANPTGSAPVINLDRVGQNFSNQSLTPFDINLVFEDQCNFDNNAADCVPGGDQQLETIVGPNVGFFDVLATPQWLVFPFDADCDNTVADNDCPARTSFTPTCGVGNPNPPPVNFGSGFYPADSTPFEPLGARVLGRTTGDRFGTTMTVSRPSSVSGQVELVVSAPLRSSGDGIGFVLRHTNLWGGAGVRPKPHQYLVDVGGYIGGGRSGGAFSNTHLVGDLQDRIENIEGIEDFNGDGRGDLVVGAPHADSNFGLVYIAYRREPGAGGLEGDFLLTKLGLPPVSEERLDGLLLRGRPEVASASPSSPEGLGFSIADGFDFNNDGISDLALGRPNADGGTGEVIILFGGTGILSPEGGFVLNDILLRSRTAAGGPVAVRIRGATVAGEKGQFGFNIANAGDVDGDGLDDLVVAAPNATPRFDPDPNDGVDQLTAPGVDNNLDGVRDQVPGSDNLEQAGLVYLILGKNRLDQVRTCQGTQKSCTSAADCPVGTGCTLTDPTINIEELGTTRLQGLIIAGRRAGDYLGGGDAGDAGQGGSSTKFGKGRSRGLASAGDVDGDGRADILIGAVLADPRRDPNTGIGVSNGGEVYLFYGSNVP